MTEVRIDLRNCELLIGNAAIEERLTEGGPNDIIPFTEYLDAPGFPLPSGNIAETRPRRAWTKDELIDTGKWIVDLYNKDPAKDDRVLTIAHHHRLAAIGLLPRYRRIDRTFGGVPAYREAIGLEKNDHRESPYNNWSTEDFVIHGYLLARQLGRRPRLRDYKQAEGPSNADLEKHFGGVVKLNALIGYPKTSECISKEALLAWGLQACEANTHLDFTEDILEILINRKQAPRMQAITQYFFRAKPFLEQARVNYAKMAANKAAATQEKLQEFARLQQAVALPEQTRHMSEEDRLKFLAQYKVAKTLLPKLDESDWAAIASHERLIAAVHSRSSNISVRKIEATAHRLGVFRDIWQLNAHKTLLYVSPEELRMRRPHHMQTETYIDTRNGELLIGRAAITGRLDEAGPDAVLPLADILTKKEFAAQEFPNLGEPPSRSWNWERQNYVDFGKWVVRILADATETPVGKVMLTEQHINRLHKLRLCPTFGTFRRNLDLDEYRAEIGAVKGASGNSAQYRDLIADDFLNYARKLDKNLRAKGIQRRLTRKDFSAADGPSFYLLSQLGLSLADINEKLGYQKLQGRDETDHLEWGQKVLEANDGRLTTWHIRALAKKHRGPSLAFISRHFGNITTFREEIAAYQADRSDNTYTEAALLSDFDKLQNVENFPRRLLKASAHKKCAFTARYWVARASFPDGGEVTHAYIARSAKHFVSALREYRDITDGELKVMAVRLNVFDYIWPPRPKKQQDENKDYLDYLHVSAEELERERRQESEYRQRLRHRSVRKPDDR